MTTTASRLDMSVGDAMRSGVLSCPPETPLRTVARMMNTYSVHTVVVTLFDPEGESENVGDVITALDVVRCARDADFADLTAGDAPKTDLPRIGASETLSQAATLMVERSVDHLLVVWNKQPVGILSALDLSRALASRSAAEY